jgi:hypothetical protein
MSWTRSDIGYSDTREFPIRDFAITSLDLNVAAQKFPIPPRLTP